MSAETVSQAAALTTEGSARWAGASRRERNFYIALTCAALIHASAFIGVFAAKPKELGDPTGQENAISVSLVTEADLQSRSTVAEPPVAPPSPAQKAQPPAPPPKPPEPETKAEPQPQAEQSPPEPETKEATTETPPPPAPDTPKPAEQQQAKLEETKPDDNVPDLFSLPSENPANMKSAPEAQPKKEESKPAPSKSTSSKPASKPKQQKQKKISQLDLSPPDFNSPSLSGRAAAFQRPPGITKSGLNDAFARAVIRALQLTMPQIQGTLGRVTVRIFLSETGDVIEVKLLGGAKDPALNQSVVFAARQTSYPIPPTGSNTADRTFMVTYIYD